DAALRRRPARRDGPAAAPRWTWTPRSSIPRPNGSEIIRATPSEGPGGLPGRSPGRRPTRMGRLLLPAGRPDVAGADPRGGRAAADVGPVGLRARAARVPRLGRLGRPDARPDRPRRADAVRLVVLVPGARRAASAGLAGVPDGPGALHGGSLEPGDCGAR